VEYSSIGEHASSNLQSKSVPFVRHKGLLRQHSFRICDVEILEYGHRTHIALAFDYNAVDEGKDAMLQPPLEVALLCERVSLFPSSSQIQEVRRRFTSVPSSHTCNIRRANRAVSHAYNMFASSW
jgi:hypothetical protein